MKAAPADMSRVTDVTYQVVVAREENGQPGEIVYEADNLAATERRIPVPLSRGYY